MLIKFFKFILWTSFYGLTVCSFRQQSDLRSTRITNSIAQEVNKYLLDMSSENITSKMKKHYQTMKLMNKSDAWVHPYFYKRSYSNWLLPENNISAEDLTKLVDAMAENAAKNPYLIEALKFLSQGSYPNIYNKIKEEGCEVIPDVISLAMVLERLTVVLSEDWRLFEVCHDIWKTPFGKYNVKNAFTKVTENLFPAAKYLSVKEVARRRIKAFKSQTFERNAWINPLVVNILEAVLEDERLEHFDNAEVGKILAKYPHTKYHDSETNSGPCKFSSNRKHIGCSPSLPLHWTNLYITWNMAFVTKSKSFVYAFPKLLIPSVTDYQDRPESFLDKRVVSLYAYINWLVNADLKIDWSNKSFTQDFGKVNLRSKQDYVEKLATAKSKTPKEIESKKLNYFIFSLKKFVWTGVIQKIFHWV